MQNCQLLSKVYQLFAMQLYYASLNQLLVKLWSTGVFQADFGPGPDYTYQTDTSMLLLMITLQVYFLCCLVSLKAVSLYPCYFSSTLKI